MLSQITLLTLASSAAALMITSPGRNDLWDLSKTNEIKWSSVNTDPQTFDIYLSHMSGQPATNTLLIADANKDSGSFTVKDLQLPIGTAYQINFVAHDKPEQIYAQSQQFNTTGEAVAATSTLDGYTGPTYTPSASSGAAQTQTETDEASSTRTSVATTVTGSTTRTTLRTLTTTSGSATITQTTSATTTEAVESVTNTAAGAATPSASTPASAGAVNGASAPLAALVFGIAAFFL